MIDFFLISQAHGNGRIFLKWELWHSALLQQGSMTNTWQMFFWRSMQRYWPLYLNIVGPCLAFFLWVFCLLFFSLKCWILAAWWVKFDASHWTFYYDPSGFQSSNNHPGNGRLAWLSWAVWHTIDCCGILMIIALNEWFSLWRSIYYFLYLCYHHVMFDISISLNFIFERIFIQSETWDFGDQMGNCFHIDIPDSNYKLCCTCCINSSGLSNAIFSLKI